jgi:arylsulfatase A-like enzyme
MLEGIENIVIFMADDVRWDFAPKSLREKGVSFKTVSAGTTTYLSTVSMLTGVHPLRHGVISWNHTIPRDLMGLLELEHFNIGYYNAYGEKDGLNSVLRQNEQKSLSELEPPFVYFERDYGAHIPYRGTGYSGTIEDFYRQYSQNKAKIRKKYKQSIKASIKRFNERLHLLGEKDLLNKTIVIFNSDHGELLGEYGLVDHTAPLVPELVYVPTIFINPGLKPRLYSDRIMRHVDLLPTLLKILDKPIPEQCEGQDIFSQKVTTGSTYAMKPIYLKNRVFKTYLASGVWNHNGGHVFNKTNLLIKILITFALITGKNWKSRYLRKNLKLYPHALKNYISRYKKFGNPDITHEKAIDFLKKLGQEKKFKTGEIKLDNEIIERLKDLGYL